ncbi:hypothetical protein FGO68_gene8392 [Halteria grandinella]|uniref:Uncharacterized protein n=1 Tax=Halteria grandinella TaxID=5974 RepID=A0A8J8NQ20_HALGN|nr:hypothetical protein FGO68_gene8392 [Halteria grandinella]
MTLINYALAAETCNSTEQTTFKTPDNIYNATPSLNRCNSVRCLYHSDCQSKNCLKLDNQEHMNLEGICANKSINEQCQLTVIDIKERPKSQSQLKLNYNRCEYVPCMYDSECGNGLYCKENRYCSNDITTKPFCNKSVSYGYRDQVTGLSEEIGSSNRCQGVQCTASAECNSEAPNCVEGVCREQILAPVSIQWIIIITGVASLLIGIVIGVLFTRCLRNRGKNYRDDLSSERDSRSYSYRQLTPTPAQQVIFQGEERLASTKEKKQTINEESEYGTDVGDQSIAKY